MSFAPENVVLGLAWLAQLASIIAVAFYVKQQGYDHYLRAQRLALTSAALYALATLLLWIDFARPNLRIAYVHDHTSVGTPGIYRLAGLWAGHPGTLLLWVFFASGALALNAWVWQRKADRGEAPLPDPQHPLAWTLLFGGVVVLALGLLVFLVDPFGRTEAWRLALYPTGRGLQPVLRTPFMVIHPPLQFFAYGLAVLLFAAALAHLVTRRPEWADVALPWARGTLLASWTGLGLGALWAYYVLNFGGYWSWDPVETANLLTVLPLIPLVHGLIYYRKRRLFAVMAPLFGLLTLPATLFSTLTTRTGLWLSVHAFTDPSRNFARDPLRRLLNILDESQLARAFTSLFLLCLLAVAAAYLYHLRRTNLASPARSSFHVQGTLQTAFAFALGFLASWSLLDARLALGAVFEVAARLWPGHPLQGLGILALLVAVIASVPAVLGRDEPAPKQGTLLERALVMSSLVFFGMVLVALATLVVFLLDLSGVNGYQRQAYDVRAPFLALPLLLVLGVALSNPFIGRGRSLLVAGVALATGLLLSLFLRSHWQVALVAPALFFALAASSLKLVKVSDAESILPLRLRLAGTATLLGGVAALAYWANPPTALSLLGISNIFLSPWAAAFGFPLGLLALLGGVSALQGRNWRLALAGSIALAASLAWVVLPLVGLAAAVVFLRARSQFSEGVGSWDLRSTVAGLQRPFRKTGVYLVHVALVLGMAGYATSVYLEGSEVRLHVSPGQDAAAHGYTFHLLSSETHGTDPDSQLAQELHAHLVVTRGSRVVAEAPLVLWLELPEHYAERVSVQRLVREDLYLHPVEVRVTGASGPSPFVPHQDGVQLFPDAQVASITFTARTLPGMHLVWAGVWLIATGVLIAFVFGGYRFETTRPGNERPRRAQAND